MRKRKKNTKRKGKLFGRKRVKPCHYCGSMLTRQEATLDHVVAFSRGGYDRLKNLVICCRKCNSRKGAKTVSQWQKYLNRKAERESLPD